MGPILKAMTEAEDELEKKGSRRRFWKKKRWWVLLILAAFVIWLDGPGWRVIARWAADRYLPDAGLSGMFEPTGRLSSGRIGIRGLALEGTKAVTLANVEDVEINYDFRRIFRGQPDAIRISGGEIDIDLAAGGEKEDSAKVDPGEVLREIQRRLEPVDIVLSDIRLTLRRGTEVVMTLAPTNLTHPAGSTEFTLDAGEIHFPETGTIPAQTAKVTWASENLALDRLEVLPELRIEDLEVRHVPSQPLNLTSVIGYRESALDLAYDFTTASVESTGSPIPAGDLLRLFGIDVPLEADVRSLKLTASGLDELPASLRARLDFAAEDIDYDGWSSSRLDFDATLDGGELGLRLDGEALDAPLEANIDARLAPDDGFQPSEASVRLEIPALSPALRRLGNRFTETTEFPEAFDSTLTATGNIRFEEGRPSGANTTVSLTGNQEASPARADLIWTPEDGLSAEVALDGATIRGSIDPGFDTYEGSAILESFRPAGLSPWTGFFGVALPGGLATDAVWSGNGNLTDATHNGSLDLSRLEWQPTENQEPVIVTASATYQWPEALTLPTMEASQGEQRITTAVALRDHRLDLTDLSWHDQDITLLSGTAEIPVPGDLTDWRAILRSSEDADLKLSGKDLPLSRLNPFLPETTRFTSTSRGAVDFHLSGSPADLVLDATVSARDVSLESRSELPPLSLDLTATGRETTLKLEGQITTPGYPPAVIDAVTTWDPRQWAEDPETARQAPLDATLDLSQLQLESFASLVPKARKLTGEINARVELTGTVGEPKPYGLVTLDGAAFETHDPSIPRLNGGALRITATPEKIVIENLSGDVSGGTFEASGEAVLGPSTGENESPIRSLDVRLKADSLPVLRNESTIVRTSADLTLRGPWRQATLGGDIRVVDSLYFRDFEILPIGAPTGTVAEPQLPSVDAEKPESLLGRIPEPFRDWRLDLDIRTRNPFLIRGNLAGGEVYLDARINGTVGNPRPSGEAKLREVTAQLPFSTLNITSGRVILLPERPFDPRLDLRGSSTVRPYEVDLYVYGPLSDPSIQPTSNPPLPQSEILTLLATGATSKGLEDTDAAAARAAQLLIEEMRRGRVGAVRWMRPVFGLLDKIDFQVGEQDPYSSRRFNSLSLEVDDNWLFTAGVGEEGNARTKITYLLRFR